MRSCLRECLAQARWPLSARLETMASAALRGLSSGRVSVPEGPGRGLEAAQSQHRGRQPALFTFLITGTKASHSQVSFQQTRLIGCNRASCHLAARR